MQDNLVNSDIVHASIVADCIDVNQLIVLPYNDNIELMEGPIELMNEIPLELNVQQINGNSSNQDAEKEIHLIEENQSTPTASNIFLYYINNFLKLPN